MRILIVCSGNAPGFEFEKHQAFIYDQVKAVEKADAGIWFDYFFIRHKGFSGYLKSRQELVARLAETNYDYIHAHFSLSALLANLQRKVPVISTFHGSDINVQKLRLISAAVELLSEKTIYVSDLLRKRSLVSSKNKSFVLPCGIDFDIFKIEHKETARKQLGFKPDKKYILFSSAFDNPVKNYPLAREAIGLLANEEIELIELKNFSRVQVAQLLSAADAALMTSHTEGSPQFVKEALACNCPVITTDVGDARHWIAGVEGCYLTSYEPADVADKLRKVLSGTVSIRGREAVQSLDNRLIARRLIEIYRGGKNA
nr:glycosyltransferase family 4 protein [uncultured Dyadobacter sp.]